MAQRGDLPRSTHNPTHINTAIVQPLYIPHTYSLDNNPHTCRADGLCSGVALTCSCKLYCCVYVCLCIFPLEANALDNKVCLMLLFIHVYPYLYTAVSISPDTSDSVPILASSAAVAGGLIIAAIAVMTTIICVCVMKRKKGR